jgi:type I restriction enzyme S subunit
VTFPPSRVGDLAEQVRGVSYGKQDASDAPLPGYLPVLRAGNITDDGLIFDDLVFVPMERISLRQRIRRNDVVIAASSGSLDVVGKAAPALEDYNGSFGAFCKVLRPNSKVHPSYFAHFFKTKSYRQRISALATGANINNLRNEHLDDLEILLPPLDEQRRIAELLDRPEALRAKRRTALGQLHSLTQSLFLDLFGDPFTNPRGWPVFQFSEVCETTQGVQIPRDAQKEEPADGYDRYLYINDFYSDESPKYVEDRYSQKRVTTDDLVMANTGSPGRVFKGRPGILSNNLFKISFDTRKISQVFFYYFLASDRFQRHLQAQMKQGIQSHLGHKTFGIQKLPLPPIALQREFARRLGAVERVKTVQHASLVELDALFATLQYRAFRGEL